MDGFTVIAQAHTLEPVRCFSCGKTLVSARAGPAKFCCKRMLMSTPRDHLPRDAGLWQGPPEDRVVLRVADPTPTGWYIKARTARLRICGGLGVEAQ